ncbi:diphosphomevalonate decarboxylase [Vagococcus xieshaowenii]|uniref:diphosphomevalonate decarboxylase n=1 Tax=Vagococcus xieshaowenii TaxID=2562451 RepID=A0AAJ5EEH8_9ENTE|nr:diphosphomevalonate decarboxylase [Vagococcus xieshaowenii]QCA28665.1 diphosphomevalonate decarboxylase [Vagococcus xieshaowenii]TFZ40527.1 diphosphomevalonate decarboxylase [Vagococcus xieshaowenii]
MKHSRVTARAHTNIALIKYWGKRDTTLFLPMNSSLSLTLDEFYTDTTVSFIDGDQDVFFLNGVEQPLEECVKISKFIELFRTQSSIKSAVLVESHNHVPTAAGLASSASAFAALGTALNELFVLRMDKQTLSTFVRQGSGSATRSIYGGFVEWQMGIETDGSDSYAIKVDDADWNIAMLTIPVNTRKKEISSREGMKLTVETSPFYPAWVEQAGQDIKAIKQAINNQDFIALGELTEANGMKMHGTMLGANPPFSYWEPLTVKVLQRIREIRGQGIPCYYTMDAGPNVKVICQADKADEIKKLLDQSFPDNTTIISGVGKDAYLLSVE